MRNKEFNQETLLKIKREFSKTEKYNLLVKSHNEMEKKLENYKHEVITITDKYVSLKKQHAELQEKYTKLRNVHTKKYHTRMD